MFRQFSKNKSQKSDSEKIIFNAAKKKINEFFPNGKLPKIADLRAEINEHYSQKKKLYEDYNFAKSELKNIEIAKKNVEKITEQPAQKRNRGYSVGD